MKIVLDTNVLVSAVLSPRGRPADVLNLVLNGRIIVCFDDRIINEYQGVLSRETFKFDLKEIKTLMSFLANYGEYIVPDPVALRLEDPEDLMFYEVLESSNADFLITGNIRHFRSAKDERIVTPAEFINKHYSGMTKK
jgi:uncharacterized protein